AHHRNSKIRWRAAEHIGQDGDAIAAVDALNRFDDILAALLDIVVGADRHCLDLALRTYDVLQGRAELDGQPPVGHQHQTNHETPRARVPGAPHERLLILTIRSPSARGIFADIWRLLRCDSESSDTAQRPPHAYAIEGGSPHSAQISKRSSC